tara:strand:- start:8 stop:493 length:486 start_codon:yes stop_codon:yes gene_type:complete
MIEEFRDVVGYEGIYKVSNLGGVKSLKFNREKTLKLSLNSRGYLNVSLYKEGKQHTHMIHQLVAISFLNHTPNGISIVVDHIDENPLNNRLDNLQLLSHRDNVAKGFKYKGGTSKHTGVSWYKQTNEWMSTIVINGKQKYLGKFACELKAAKAYQDALKAL